MSLKLLLVFFLQVSAATKVPKRLEISEWRERQEETGPPRPLLSPSSSVQWTDRHCRWFPPVVPPAPPAAAPGPPAVGLFWDSSDSARRHKSKKKDRFSKTAWKWEITRSYWFYLIQMSHLNYTLLIKPVSSSHPTLNLLCEINSTLPPYPITTNWKRHCRQSFLLSSSPSSSAWDTCETHLGTHSQSNLERSNLTTGHRVKGHRENWPLTLLDPIYCYKSHAMESTFCHQSVNAHIKWSHRALRKSIHCVIKCQLWDTLGRHLENMV